jgi:2-phosphosulfolactate phosphatase
MQKISFGWGRNGLHAGLPDSDVVIIVDVLSFSTAVDVATGCGAFVFPYAYGRDDAAAYAAEQSAMLAQPRAATGGQFSLSPRSLATMKPGQRIVLPSPNGSMLSREANGVPTLAGCLRNAHAVAEAAAKLGDRITVIAAGEKWPDGTLRPALEDVLGAGAIIAALTEDQPRVLTPDADAAQAVYRAMKDRCPESIHACASGQELIAAGYADDVAYAVAENVSRTVPRLVDGAYRDSGDD